MLTYKEARELLKKAANPVNGKPLGNNTRLFQRCENYAVCFHTTDVVTIHPDGTYTLNSGGWRTYTTKDRINKFSPVRVFQTRKEWFLNFGPDKKSPMFFDGAIVTVKGKLVNESAAPSDLRLRASNKVSKLVAAYIRGWDNRLRETKALASPGPGDCFFCQAMDPEGEMSDHLLSHLQEKYFVPSLLWNAAKETETRPLGGGNACYRWEFQKMDVESGLGLTILKRDLRRYFRERHQLLTDELLDQQTKTEK